MGTSATTGEKVRLDKVACVGVDVGEGIVVLRMGIGVGVADEVAVGVRSHWRVPGPHVRRRSIHGDLHKLGSLDLGCQDESESHSELTQPKSHCGEVGPEAGTHQRDMSSNHAGRNDGPNS